MQILCWLITSHIPPLGSDAAETTYQQAIVELLRCYCKKLSGASAS
jgi:hypothetical protein